MSFFVWEDAPLPPRTPVFPGIAGKTQYVMEKRKKNYYILYLPLTFGEKDAMIKHKAFHLSILCKGRV